MSTEEPTTREFTAEDGTVLRFAHEPGAYDGSTSYEIEGEFDQVTAHVERLLSAWPTPGYGTWFNWPPGSKTIQWGENKGQPVTHRAPTDLGNGRWIARGHRSNSCD